MTNRVAFGLIGLALVVLWLLFAALLAAYGSGLHA